MVRAIPSPKNRFNFSFGASTEVQPQFLNTDCENEWKSIPANRFGKLIIYDETYLVSGSENGAVPQYVEDDGDFDAPYSHQ